MGDGVRGVDVVVDDVVDLLPRLGKKLGGHALHLGNGNKVLLQRLHPLVGLLHHDLVHLEGPHICRPRRQ